MSAGTDVKIVSRSVSETKRIGKKMGRLLKTGDVVALEGELGAGKTTLVKGIALGLGVRNEDEVMSPTFVLIHEYQGREKIYHLDWYRLKKVSGTDLALAEECLSSPSVCLVEWPQRGRGLLPRAAIRVRIDFSGPKFRKIQISARDARHAAWIKALKK